MTRDRLIQTALLASVGLNLFLVGTIVPRWFHHMPPGGHPMQGPDMPGPGPEGFDKMGDRGPGGPGGPGGPADVFRRALDKLPEADATILKAHFGENFETLAEKGKEMRKRVDRIRELIRAEPFDAAALRTAFEAAASDRATFETEQMEAFLTVLGKLSPEARKLLAELPPPRLMVGNDGPGPMPHDGQRPDKGPPGGIPMDRDRGPMELPPPPPDGK